MAFVPQIKVRDPSDIRLGARTLGFGSGLSTRQWPENTLFSEAAKVGSQIEKSIAMQGLQLP
jgi:hypothetical protein